MQWALSYITHDRLRPSQPPHSRRCCQLPRADRPNLLMICSAWPSGQSSICPLSPRVFLNPFAQGALKGSKTNPFPTVMGLNKPKNLKDLIGTMTLTQRRCLWSRGTGVAGCGLRGKYSAFQRVMLTADHSGNSTKGSGRPQTQQRQGRTRAAVRPHSLGQKSGSRLGGQGAGPEL